MLVLLSPAKSLDWSAVPATTPPSTTPVLDKDIGVLMRTMKRKKAADLAALMHISDSLAQLNRERYEQMSGAPDDETGRPAALAFDGDVYRGLGARTLDADALTWAQDHIAILSGLYGVLRPLDRIEPYRLEMGTRLQTRRGSSLYAFWGDKVTKVLNNRLAALPSEQRLVVNLASNEYAKVVGLKNLQAPVITPVFKELSNGKAKVISFFAKRARGMMARAVVEGRFTQAADLQHFTGGGYAFQPAESTDTSWLFTRPKPPPASAR